jgi:hypothetical protein
MHLALDLKQYMVFKVSPNSQPTHLQGPPSNVRLVVMNPHMVVIPMHVGKNIMEDVMLDGESVDESITHLLASIGTFCLFVEIVSDGKEQEKSISELMSCFGNNTFSESNEKVQCVIQIGIQ